MSDRFREVTKAAPTKCEWCGSYAHCMFEDREYGTLLCSIECATEFMDSVDTWPEDESPTAFHDPFGDRWELTLSG